ncbi:helicase-exonuclease AddAB subunit AddB [Metabacillus arenae]|uniref:ATP-dependent helicase/deoxyribonuclease subunit B n=1 Tax=Metabacillus arenae TaxID=2771434 RepID=A0A926RX50_9BACI|nr:helicase-exonuclease AddAB subunit AddB [Metabacillus arenae]MBD1380626.1 helicase-exonuclease AddAB subunit AddB [Metabacillus arenae]
MAVHFLLGRSGSGKTAAILSEIRSKLADRPQGKPIILLVPDQMTFAMEYELIKTLELGGIIRAQAFSFTRLAWRILQEEGGINRRHLSSTGIQMMIRKIIEERKQDFKVYSKASDKSGFVSHIEQMTTEFKRYCLSPDELEQQIKHLTLAQNPSERALADKLHDLVLLYKELERELSNQYIDSEDYLQMLAEKIPESSYLNEAEIFVDGFHSFTPQEFMVIEALMKHCINMTFSLTADKPFHEHLPHELHLFRMTGMTYHKLTEKAKEHHIDCSEEVLSSGQRYAGSASLSHLEKNYDARPAQPYFNEADINIVQAANRRAEIEGIARSIQKLVREKGYCYQDTAILIRNLSDYRDLVEQIFLDYEIPFFADEKRAMLHHPLIEFIRSSLEVIKGNWRYEAVFRCIKTDLLLPVTEDRREIREELDQLENYVLAYGIKGEKWFSDDRWTYRRYYSLDDDYVKTDQEREMEDLVNRLKELISPPLRTLQLSMKKAKTGTDYAEALYQYLEDLDIPSKINLLKTEAEVNGHLIEAREHDQVWNAVIDLLDEFVEMLQDRSMTFTLFQEMIDTGLETMKFALVPPAIDQVLVANLERSRFFNIKCTFLVGVNDGVLPAKPSEEGILTEDEREVLFHQGIELAPTARQQLLDENFLIYMALSSASEKLTVSYPMSDEEGRSLLPSIVIKRLNEMYPNIQLIFYTNEPQQFSAEEQLDYLVNPSVTLSYLTGQLQSWKNHYSIDDLWWDSYNLLLDDQEWKWTSRKLISSLFYKNEAASLEEPVSRELYGETILGSVSRMEMFKACPFSHFASHGLKLKERQMFRLEAPDVGQLFHAALKLISDRLYTLKMDWKDLTKQQCERLSYDAVERLAPRLQREILLSSNRHHYLKRKLQKIIMRASAILSEHAKASGFTPVGLELGFGKNGPLPPIQFKLDNGCEMELIGRIDRVDKAESSNGLLLRVIDYKSSDKSLNLSEVYYGIALQMLTYLDVIISYSKDWLGVKSSPAGVLYFHVHDPMIQTNTKLSEDLVEEEIFKKFKMKGLLLGDEEAVRLMDSSLDSGRSNIVSAGLKKDGSFRSDSAIASKEEFSLLRTHIRDVFKQIGTDITNGVVDIAPYKIKEKVPCTFCDFKSVCQFDQSLEENEYRVLKDEKGQDILNRLREEAK